MDDVAKLNEAVGVIAEMERRRKELAAQCLAEMQQKYGVFLKPRVIIDGNIIDAQLVLTLDPSWQPQPEPPDPALKPQE